jgi:hypothetical protein
MQQPEQPLQNPRIKGDNLSDAEWAKLAQVTVKDVADAQRFASDEVKEFIEADATS